MIPNISIRLPGKRIYPESEYMKYPLSFVDAYAQWVITNSQNDQLPVDVITQLIGHWTCIAEVI